MCGCCLFHIKKLKQIKKKWQLVWAGSHRGGHRTVLQSCGGGHCGCCQAATIGGPAPAALFSLFFFFFFLEHLLVLFFRKDFSKLTK
jgi:hypothetical protein